MKPGSVNTQFNLSGKIALVTGASRGIGAAIAQALGEAGARVGINYSRSKEPADEVVEAIRQTGSQAAALHADMSQDAAARDLFEGCREQLGEPDILVLNVSIQHVCYWTEITREQFDEQVTINLRSALELLQLCVPGMQERRWGRILTIGSVQETRPHPQMLVYSALKNAQTGMVRNLAKQLAPFNITVNNLAPGVINTDRSRERLVDEDYTKKVLSWIPMNRVAEAEECTGAALLLCSDAGSYITGQNLYVDGGMSL